MHSCKCSIRAAIGPPLCSGTICALANTGVGYCWGDNTNGQVGDTTVSTTRDRPTVIGTDGNTWASLDVGGYMVCGIKSSTPYNTSTY